jgi:CMP-N,N'-diacetyllegionaminic acid synthase
LTGSVLGIIPARGGSKGIPGKNVRPLAGRSLIEYAVDVARASGVVDRLILSTDSEEIAALGRRIGLEVPFLRPAALAQDDTPTLPVLEHAVAFLEHTGWSPEIVVLLQPTAPLRRPEHIVDAVTLLRTSRCDSVVTVVEIPRHFSPDYAMKIVDGRLTNFLTEGQRLTRRQDTRAAYSRDGTIYTFWRDLLMKHHTIYGTNCRPLILSSHEVINLDTPEDWVAAERRLMARS